MGHKKKKRNDKNKPPVTEIPLRQVYKQKHNHHRVPFQYNLYKMSEREAMARYGFINRLIQVNPFFAYLTHLTNPTNNHLKYTNKILEEFIEVLCFGDFNSDSLNTAIKQLYSDFIRDYQNNYKYLVIQIQEQQRQQMRQYEQQIKLIQQTNSQQFVSFGDGQMDPQYIQKIYQQRQQGQYYGGQKYQSRYNAKNHNRKQFNDQNQKIRDNRHSSQIKNNPCQYLKFQKKKGDFRGKQYQRDQKNKNIYKKQKNYKQNQPVPELIKTQIPLVVAVQTNQVVEPINKRQKIHQLISQPTKFTMKQIRHYIQRSTIEELQQKVNSELIVQAKETSQWAIREIEIDDPQSWVTKDGWILASAKSIIKQIIQFSKKKYKKDKFFCPRQSPYAKVLNILKVIERQKEELEQIERLKSKNLKLVQEHQQLRNDLQKLKIDSLQAIKQSLLIHNKQILELKEYISKLQIDNKQLLKKMDDQKLKIVLNNPSTSEYNNSLYERQIQKKQKKEIIIQNIQIKASEQKIKRSYNQNIICKSRAGIDGASKYQRIQIPFNGSKNYQNMAVDKNVSLKSLKQNNQSNQLDNRKNYKTQDINNLKNFQSQLLKQILVNLKDTSIKYKILPTPDSKARFDQIINQYEQEEVLEIVQKIEKCAFVIQLKVKSIQISINEPIQSNNKIKQFLKKISMEIKNILKYCHIIIDLQETRCKKQSMERLKMLGYPHQYQQNVVTVNSKNISQPQYLECLQNGQKQREVYPVIKKQFMHYMFNRNNETNYP